jgi:hypothetical protein
LFSGDFETRRATIGAHRIGAAAWVAGPAGGRLDRGATLPMVEPAIPCRRARINLNSHGIGSGSATVRSSQRTLFDIAPSALPRDDAARRLPHHGAPARVRRNSPPAASAAAP